MFSITLIGYLTIIEPVQEECSTTPSASPKPKPRKPRQEYETSQATAQSDKFPTQETVQPVHESCAFTTSHSPLALRHRHPAPPMPSSPKPLVKPRSMDSLAASTSSRKRIPPPTKPKPSMYTLYGLLLTTKYRLGVCTSRLSASCSEYVH